MGKEKRRRIKLGDPNFQAKQAPMLTQMPWASHDGGKRRGPPRVGGAFFDGDLHGDQEDLEDVFQERGDLRELLKATIGSENEYDKLRAIAAKELTWREVAKAEGVNPGTAHRRYKKEVFPDLRRRLADLALSLFGNGAAWRPCLQRFLDIQIGFVSDAAEAAIAVQSGAVVSPKTATVLPAQKSFAVAIDGFEEVSSRKPTAWDIGRFVRSYQDQLFGSSEVFLGVWFNDRCKTWTLAVTILISTMPPAMAALAHKKGTIFSLAGGQLICPDKDDRQAA